MLLLFVVVAFLFVSLTPLFYFLCLLLSSFVFSLFIIIMCIFFYTSNSASKQKRHDYTPRESIIRLKCPLALHKKSWWHFKVRDLNSLLSSPNVLLELIDMGFCTPACCSCSWLWCNECTSRDLCRLEKHSRTSSSTCSLLSHRARLRSETIPTHSDELAVSFLP